ncbi:hypothetical protein N9U94_05140 [Acidimicrobiaceae bacterium]|nr:hypothetical protein [Acidimicrobiaceae bacterium]
MEIKNNKGDILALIYNFSDISEEKTFLTENSQEFQIGGFNLKKDDYVERHIHHNQKREVHNTSEVIFVISGEIEIEIYDIDKSFLIREYIQKNTLVALFRGGHSIKVVQDSKFIEVKQGPYIESIDKERF